MASAQTGRKSLFKEHAKKASQSQLLNPSSIDITGFDRDNDQLRVSWQREEEEAANDVTVLLEIATLEQLYRAVRDRDGDRECPVTPTIFTRILQERTSIEPSAAERLFEKIDWTSLSKVSWSEFCSFMQLEFSIKEKRQAFTRVVSFILPAPTSPLPHRDPGCCVMNTPDGLWITASSEATIALWNNDARLKRYKLCLSKQRTKKKLQRQWVTASALMPEFSKVILTTGDREIQFFDMASFSPFCQISGLESIPIAMCYKAVNRDKCLLTYGDQMGCISVLTFLCMGKSFRMWKKLPKHEDFIPSIPVEQAIVDSHVSFTRWQVHKDWVNLVRYYLETDQIVSSSKDSYASLVIGRRRGSTNVAKSRKEGSDQKGKRPAQLLYDRCTRPRQAQDQIVYTLTRGIHEFDYCPKLKMVASGGSDRVIRLWSSFLNKKPIAKLWGHFDIIKYLGLQESTKRLYSVSGDLWVKVWDIQEHTCLLTVPRHLHMVIGELQSVCLNKKTSSLAMYADNIGVLTVKIEEDRYVVWSHKAPVTCIVYNPTFNHIISAGDGSTVKTWNIDTGRLEGEFMEAHETYGVSAMTLDSTNKRLITVGMDGRGRMWNYNTGQCVRLLQGVGDNVAASTVTYIDMRNIKYVLQGGWNHRLNLYIDDTPETIPFELPLLSFWRDDLVRGHTEDILCSDFSQRDKVATGGFDGVVMVWNMETCHRAHLLVPPVPQGWSTAKLEADKGVTCLHFLKLRSRQRRGGNLVVGGPYGHISIWNTNFARQASSAMAHFPVRPDDVSPDDVVSVTALDSDEDNALLAAGDINGRVTLWDIQSYALFHQEERPPVQLCYWEAHLARITGVKITNNHNLVVTSSADHTVRLWTKNGHYIGTFGQKEAWNVEDESTYKHPELPKDIQDFRRPPEDELQQDLEQSEEVPDEELTERQIEHYERGLSYFARAKAKISQKKRHLNDEMYSAYSCMGDVVPYQSLRHHSLQSPPGQPDKAKVTQDLKEAEDLCMKD